MHEIDIRDAEVTGHLVETAKPDVIVHLDKGQLGSIEENPEPKRAEG